jgi:hypothetical protein
MSVSNFEWVWTILVIGYEPDGLGSLGWTVKMIPGFLSGMIFACLQRLGLF